jgi:hypothetical protein
MKICIDDELKKIKQLLDKTIDLDSEIVPNYDWGNKVSIKCYQKIDNKLTKVEYSFYIEYYEDKDNYANADYLLHCDYSYSTGGHSYADKYESIEDFKKTNMYVKELLEEYGKQNRGIGDKKNNKTEELTLFDTEEDIEDNEILDVSNDNQMSIFEMEEFNQLSMFDEIEDNNVDLKDLMSYGIDDYYKENCRGNVLWTIKEALEKLPNYKEYYNKLKKYVESKLPLINHDEAGSDFSRKLMFYVDGVITVRGNRQQCPVYCYSMIPKGIID